MRATVRARSRPFAQTTCLQGFPCKRANGSEPERTPNLAILATESGVEPGLGDPPRDHSCAFSDNARQTCAATRESPCSRASRKASGVLSESGPHGHNAWERVRQPGDGALTQPCRESVIRPSARLRPTDERGRPRGACPPRWSASRAACRAKRRRAPGLRSRVPAHPAGRASRVRARFGRTRRPGSSASRSSHPWRSRPAERARPSARAGPGPVRARAVSVVLLERPPARLFAHIRHHSA